MRRAAAIRFKVSRWLNSGASNICLSIAECGARNGGSEVRLPPLASLPRARNGDRGSPRFSRTLRVYTWSTPLDQGRARWCVKSYVRAGNAQQRTMAIPLWPHHYLFIQMRIADTARRLKVGRCSPGLHHQPPLKHLLYHIHIYYIYPHRLV